MKRTIKSLAIMLLAASSFTVVSCNNQASAEIGIKTPGWIKDLDPTVSPPKLPQAPAPLSINIFEYDLNGARCAFVRQNDGTWVEFQGANRYRFAEVARNSDFIELLDTGRNIRVRIHKNQCGVNFYGRGWQHLYWGGSR